MSDYHIVIPARMASQRLPGKPLLDIAGKSLLEHVYDRARQASAAGIVIATDDAQIFDVASGFGATVVMTSPTHESGSDRIAECADQMGWSDDQLIVNLQGDEPLMPPACLDQVGELLTATPEADVASLYWPICSSDDARNPNTVKVVTDAAGRALYFSRSAIPFIRSETGTSDHGAQDSWKRHIGLYAYRAGALRMFAAMDPTPLELNERLEQLRFLEAGRCIIMAEACNAIPAGVDTPEDLERVQAEMSH